MDEPSGDYDVLTGEVEDGSVEALPEIARMAAVVWTRTATWGLTATLRTGVRLARAAVDPQAAVELTESVRGYARELLGIDELEDRVRALSRSSVDGAWVPVRPTDDHDLRARGAELLRRSADVSDEDRVHPAFAGILAALAPDEGRMLRLLAREGPQPIVDVRAANLIGVGSQLVAPNLNMLAMQAGCRHADRVASYLVNLGRLGLVSLSDEPLEDTIRYQVLEAQPYVLEAIKATARAKTVHRSLELTAFGEGFCSACFPAEDQPTPSENVELGS